MQGPFETAWARSPGPDAVAGLTTHQGEPVDYGRLCAQHDAYLQWLRDAGVDVHVLPPLAGHPDAYFVEDAAVILGDLAVITRPGAPSRRGEAVAMAAALAEVKRLCTIEPPGTLDGGDVLWVGSTLFIGLSGRTNRAGAAQLATAAESMGLDAVTVTVPEGLHLKSSVTALNEETLLSTPEFAQNDAFSGFRHVRVPLGEEPAANSLWVGDLILLPADFPGTLARVQAAGFDVRCLDNSEIRKMDGGFSCLSLRW